VRFGSPFAGPAPYHARVICPIHNLGLSELDGVIQFIDPVSGGRDFAPVIGETLDLTAVLLGDVDGSWYPEII
jgi:hypothetical protein